MSVFLLFILAVHESRVIVGEVLDVGAASG